MSTETEKENLGVLYAPVIKTASLVMERKLLASINHPHPDNPRKMPRKGSPKREALKASLAHDYFDPLIWNSINGKWVSGHVRAELMEEMGFTHVDVIVVDYDEPTHKARMLAANAHAGKDDASKLDALLASLEQSATDPVLAMLASLPGEGDEGKGGSSGNGSKKKGGAAGVRLVIQCADEAHKAALVERLKAEGLVCK